MTKDKQHSLSDMLIYQYWQTAECLMSYC